MGCDYLWGLKLMGTSRLTAYSALRKQGVPV